jgi:hypothetical protein
MDCRWAPGALALASAAATLTCSCSSASGPTGDGLGTLTGGIELLGGPAVPVTAPVHYVAGLVRLTDSHGLVAQQNVADGALYTFRIHVGHYRLVVNMGSFDCTKSLTVRANATTRADLTCEVK